MPQDQMASPRGEDLPALLRAHGNAVGNPMVLQLLHRVVVIRFQRQITVLGIALEESSFLQESGYTVTDGMDQCFQLIDVVALQA